MDEHHKDLWAGVVLMLFCAAILLGGWLLFRLMVGYRPPAGPSSPSTKEKAVYGRSDY